MTGKDEEKPTEKNLRSSSTQNNPRRRSGHKNEELENKPVQDRTQIISQEERNTIIYNMCLLAILLLLFGTIWCFYTNSATTTTITVNSDKRYTSSIFSMCILSDTLLIAVDHSNRSIKAINTKTKKLVTTFYTEYDLWTITMVADTKLAISLSDAQKIQIISVVSKHESDKVLFAIDYDINVNGKPIGIEYWNEKLYVIIIEITELKGGLYILTMDGTVIRSIIQDSLGNNLFWLPFSIALNTQTDTMYVSDIFKDSVTSLTFDGKVKSIYKDDGLLQISGITIDALGRVYLCRQNSIFKTNQPPDILRLSEDLKMPTILLAKKHDINFPKSVVYDDKEKRLYVGSKDRDEIQVFTVL